MQSPEDKLPEDKQQGPVPATQPQDAPAAEPQDAPAAEPKHPIEEEPFVSVLGHQVRRSDIIKLAGLIAFLVLTAAIVVVLWPSFSLLFEEDGINKVIEDITSKGPFGVLTLLGLQFLQIVVAFIPGEVVQMAAGMLYGPVWGTLIILLGCVISSAVIYELVHRLGAPFVQSMIDKKYLVKFYEFEHSGKLNVLVFVLFLIPGMPKDVLTYLVPLTGMPLRTFLLLTTVGRIPGVIISTYAAAGIAEGHIVTSLIIFGVAAVLLIIGFLCRNRLMALLMHNKNAQSESGKSHEEGSSVTDK